MSRATKLFSVPGAPERTTHNSAGNVAYETDVYARYLQMLLTNSFSNTFYTKTDKLIQEADALHKEMLAKDPLFMAKALIFARNEGFMRLAPIYGLAYLARLEGTVSGGGWPEGGRPSAYQYKAKDLFHAAFRGVIRIPSDVADFLTILEGQGRGQGGRRIKREIASFLTERMSEYWALKYNGSGRGYSLGDVIALTHPKPKDEQQKMLFAYLRGHKLCEEHGVCSGVLNELGLHQLEAFETLKRAGTDAGRIAAIKQGRLPHDVITATVPNPSKTVWKAILEQMPTFAMLRHLNTFDRHGLLSDAEIMGTIRKKLTDAEGLKKSMILPMQFVKAFQAVHDNQLRDIIRQAVETTFSNLPELSGTTAIFLDRSGSMGYSMNGVILTASVFALALYKKTGGNGPVWAFNTNVYDMQPSMVDSILSQAEKVVAEYGTNCYGPMKHLHDKRIRVDNIIMLTDEQENHGFAGAGAHSRYLYDAFLDYRRDMNKNAKLFVVNMAPEQGSLGPSTDPSVFSIYGMSDQVLRYISMAQQGFGTMVDHVKKMPLPMDAQ